MTLFCVIQALKLKSFWKEIVLKNAYFSLPRQKAYNKRKLAMPGNIGLEIGEGHS